MTVRLSGSRLRAEPVATLAEVLGDTSLVEKRDEGLIRSVNQHKLKWVSIEGNALQGSEDCVKQGQSPVEQSIRDLSQYII